MRIDSGDLVYWSIVAHVLFERANLPEMRIVLSNDLNERSIALIHNEIRRSVRDEGYLREISLQVGGEVGKNFGGGGHRSAGLRRGHRFDHGGNQSSLGGVYKLVAVQGADGTWQPRIKVSAQPEKMTNPSLKQVVRLLRNGFLVADIIALPDEEIVPHKPFVGINPANPNQRTTYRDFDQVERLHVPIFEAGKLVYTPPSLAEVKAYARGRARTIRLESRRLENPHTLKVSLTERYYAYKEAVIQVALQQGSQERSEDSV